MGGIAKVAPNFSIAFLIIVLGTVALPLTNGFVGEFLLLKGVFNYNIWFAAVAGLTIIFGAVYMLRMYKNVMQGEINELTALFADIAGLRKVSTWDHLCTDHRHRCLPATYLTFIRSGGNQFGKHGKCKIM
jgi:NADH-quinone oxidoreductase subunit M